VRSIDDCFVDAHRIRCPRTFDLGHVIITIARHRSITISYIDAKLTLTTR